MCLNFIILSILVITQVLSVPVLNTYNQLKSISLEKCPFLEKSTFLEAEFLRQCDSVNEEVLNVSKINEQNVDAALCAMYSSVFKHLCDIVGLNDYNSDSLPETIEKNFKASTVKYVCDSLGNITEKVITQPLIVQTLRSSKRCKHLCTDFDDELKRICSLTSFMWTFSTVLKIKSNEVKKSTVSNHLTEESKSIQSLKLDAQTQNKKDGLLMTSNASSLDNKTALLNNERSHPELPAVQVSTELSSKDKLPIKDNENVLSDKGFSVKTSTQSLVADQNLGKAQMPNVTLKSESEPVKQTPIAPTNSNSLNNSTKDNPIETSKTDVKKTEQKDDTNIDQPPVDDSNYEDAGDDDFENFKDSPSKQTKGKTNEDDINIKDENIYGNDPVPKSSEVKVKPVEVSKPREIDEDSSNLAANFQNQNVDDSNSYFFSYFMMVCVLFICGYVAYHNKQKILALVLEGRKGRRPSRSRRPNSANYHKLDTTLEEAVTSSCNKNTTQVIY